MQCFVQKLVSFLLMMVLQIQMSAAREGMITINGGWSPWSTVATPCLREIDGIKVNVTCGGGTMIKRRSCTNPEPQVNNVT